MQLKFSKMEGCGNSFVLVNEIASGQRDWQELSRKLNDPHYGIGGDGLMVVKSSRSADFEVGMYNPDGSLMGMCGNGIRCVSRFVKKENLLKPGQKELTFIVEGRLIRCMLVDGNPAQEMVRVDMGEPAFDPKSIPLAAATQMFNQEIQAAGETFKIHALSMGNPHCVIFVENLSLYGKERLASVGPALEHHPLFPKRTNVEFVKVTSREQLEVAVWERGAGATLACGTGACASLVAAFLTGRAEAKAKVRLPGGELIVDFDQAGNHVFLTGPAREVFQGDLSVEF